MTDRYIHALHELHGWPLSLDSMGETGTLAGVETDQHGLYRPLYRFKHGLRSVPLSKVAAVRQHSNNKADPR